MLKKILKTLNLADYVLIVFIALIAVWIYYYQQRNLENQIVQVYVDNKLQGNYDIHRNQKIVINPHCSMEIKNNKVRMTHSDCRDKLCIKQGWTEKKPIICLPNRVIIEIANPKKQKQIHLLY